MNDLKGIYVPILTPFLSNGKIEWESLEAHIERLVTSNIHGVFALGSTSEALFLPLELKKVLLKETMRMVNGRLPVIVQTGCNVIDETLELSKVALDQGAKCLSVITPFYYSLEDQTLVEFYKYLGEQFPETPLCIYNFASRTRNDIHPKLLRACYEANPNVVGIKESSESLDRFSEHVRENPELAILAGTNSIILEALGIGSGGAVATLANIIPDTIAAIYNEFMAGNHENARKHQQIANEVRSVLKALGPDLQVYKLATSVFGGYHFEGMYPPHRQLSTSEKEEMIAKIKELQLSV